MARSAYVLHGYGWRRLNKKFVVHQDPTFSRLTGAVFYGKQSLQMEDPMTEAISPLERASRPGDKPCPNCGSLETVNRLQREIDAIRDRAAAKQREAKQLHLFQSGQDVAGKAYVDGGLNDYSVHVTHDVCADCGTCFDYSRMESAKDLRAELKKLRLETESAVDALGRLGEG